MKLDQVRIIAHRGNSAALPENTMAAFRSAVALGAHMLELDVRVSRDGLPVVTHDDDVARTTTSAGPVNAFHGDQLQKLGIPALEDVLALGAPVMIEIKDDAATPAVLDLIHGRTDVIVSSFEAGALDFLRQLAPDLPLAYLGRSEDCDAVLARAAEAGAYAFNPPASAVTPSLVARAHLAGLRVMPYTVNDAELARQLFTWAVDAIHTDDPARMLAIL